MKITKLNYAEVGILDHQLVISSDHIRVSWKQASGIHFFWIDGLHVPYTTFKNDPVSMVILDMSDFHIVWKEEE